LRDQRGRAPHQALRGERRRSNGPWPPGGKEGANDQSGQEAILRNVGKALVAPLGHAPGKKELEVQTAER
jgi:hypothetical protein